MAWSLALALMVGACGSAPFSSFSGATRLGLLVSWPIYDKEETMDQALVELIWCAGFWSGEGCSYGYMGGPKSRPALTLVITQSGHGVPPTLARFQRRLGGRIYPRGPSTLSVLPRWQWTAGSKAARQIMAQLLPYLDDAKLEQYSRAMERVTLAKELRKEG